ncbi:hypothetical protein EYZ11_009492 [Aspergillus tanneri]|uniref:AB hydrolase-1 domain-containing protein n=1 Tax=Aspergillus tanneri TaxID=1220188 RepID=A0A4S3J883_9EURO|nr:uncharacterized protein ATNIH1004_010350 [Aspergillus tanneri]KAA8643581.1 hypothetical protein ATNIH1004_010350 [Aspergillus tanneri]THC91052.1 hypothetical protein EYZ11_009492 [Aspergillus tanneri]
MSLNSVPPPAYEEIDSSHLAPPYYGLGQSHFFRSTTSLTLDPSPVVDGKRSLLLIYIHGFMGSEASFQNFPKHVHDLLSITLCETHVVYTKVYPRYKTRGAMHIARDQFSQWLSPHESSNLDVILLGHSLGGIVAAEVALLSIGNRIKHRILGLVNFDVPFLGLHPRVVATGIRGLFRRRPDEITQYDGSLPTEGLGIPDANQTFDPDFANDTHLAQWTGWNGARHFISKYSDHLSRSLIRYFFSYYDHAGCVNKYPELIRRHRKLLELEAIDEWSSPGSTDNRIRFVNYYTTSTGSMKSKSYDDLGPSVLAEKIDTALRELEKQETTDDGAGLDHERSGGNAAIPKSLRKFCYLPKDSIKGRDDLWIPVLMEGVDEVVGHQSMFLPRNMSYDKLVGDTAARIESWIHDDLTTRALLAGGTFKSAVVGG